MPREHVHTERVRFGDLDAMRHLNNVVFLRYFETARIASSASCSPTHDPANPEGDAFGIIFAECHIDYRSPVLFDEVVDDHVHDRRGAALGVPDELPMTVGERLAAEGYGWLVGFDYVAQRASRLPDATRAILEEAAA